MTKEDRVKELDGINQKRIQLGDLVVKLGGFVGQSESVKKAVKNAIIAIFNTNPHLKNDLKDVYDSHVTKLSESVKPADKAVGTEKISELNKLVTQEIEHLNDQLSKQNNHQYPSSPSPSPSADSAELQSKLQDLRKVNELCENYENLNTKQNEPKNLLDNLCDGLQTFLGYSKDSKGYDGTGIVYSDLDRLCDGVMGFLSGVLEAVKDDPSVKTYTLITELDMNKILDNMHNGVYGFGVCIDHVIRVLRDYDGELHKRTDAVTNLISILQASISKHISSIPQEKDVDIIDQVATWAKRAAKYIETAKTAETALNNLDTGLAGRLKCNVKSVLQATETFMMNAMNDDYWEIHSASLNTMLEVIGKVDNRFDVGIERLQRYLNAKIAELHGKLETVKRTHFYDLQTYIKNDLNTASRQVSDDIKLLEWRYVRQIVPEVEGIMKDALALGDKLKQEEKTINNQVTAFEEQIDALRNVAQEVSEKVSNDIAIFQKDGDYDLRRPMMLFTEETKREVDEYTDGLRRAIADATEQASNPYGWGNGGATAVTSLASGMRTAGFDDFANALEEAAKNSKDDIARNMQNGLYYLKKASAKLKSPNTPSEIYSQMKSKLEDKLLTTKQLGNLLHHAVKKGINKMREAVNELVEGDLNGIKDTFAGLRNKAHEGSSEIVKHAHEIHAKITKFLETNVGVDSGKQKVAQNSVYEALTRLKKSAETLHTTAITVKDKVGGVESALDECMNSTFEFFKEAPKWAKKIMDDLRQDVNGEIANAFESVQKRAKEIYVKRKQLELNTLHSIVNEQHERIEEIVNDDKRNGVKGFMKQMNDYMLLNDFKIVLTSSSKHDPTKFSQLGAKFEDYVKKILEYLKYQVMTKSKPPQPTDHSRHVDGIRESFDVLLNYLMYFGHSKYFNFTHESDKLLSNLIDSVHSLTPSSTSALDPQALPDAGRPVLKALRDGMLGFVGELGKGYVNKYDGGETIKEWVKKEGGKEVLTPEGKNGAKVFLTLLEILGHDLTMLREQCELNWKKQTVCLINSNGNRYELGRFLQHCGFKVPSKQGVQDGELKYGDTWTSEQIVSRLGTVIKEAEKVPHLQKCETNLNEHRTPKKTNNIDIFDIIECIMSHLKEYYRVGHFSTLNAKKHPLSIYDMLQWLAGIPNNPVHLELTTDGFEGLFEKRKADTTDTEDGDITVDLGVESLHTYKETITPASLSDAFTEVCAQSHSVLTAVLGHGHAGGRYACEFNTNTDGFIYPSDMNALICMMFEIAKRLHHQLYFLYRQCHDGTNLSGWSDCWYGRHIGGSAWKCNTMQCPNQTDNQKHNQSCDQKCNQTANCGLKSPLQSFLEDGLQGFLPHQVKYEKGKLECSLKHSTMPCKTPMGFADISYVASHRQQGKHLRDVLFDFCSEEWSALSRLCSLLSCLLPSAPKTLEDMFGFYNTFLSGWNKTIEREFTTTVNEANFNRNNASLEIKPIFSSSDHISDQHMTHLKGDLYSLVNCNYNSTTDPAYPCGPYLRPMCYYRCGMFSAKHNDKYLTWIVYLTETFQQLLKQFSDECSSNCNSTTAKCRISQCANVCAASNLPMSPDYRHKVSCNSIVNCKFIRPTFYKFGFVLRDCQSLSAESTKRTCKDFCMALKYVLNEEEKFQRALAKFVHVTIPKFLFTIRAPFIWLNVALWLLSFLYLLHIMVIRLDLLHIKSHLHSPSSHRIGAQSLLAAARVNKLNRVFYLQP